MLNKFRYEVSFGSNGEFLAGFDNLKYAYEFIYLNFDVIYNRNLLDSYPLCVCDVFEDKNLGDIVISCYDGYDGYDGYDDYHCDYEGYDDYYCDYETYCDHYYSNEHYNSNEYLNMSFSMSFSISVDNIISDLHAAALNFNKKFEKVNTKNKWHIGLKTP